MESSEAVVCELLLAEAQRLLAGATQQAATPQARPAQTARAPGQSAALAALADVRQAATTLGMQLLPLRSPTDLATLLVVSLLYPAGTPARATKMLAELLSRGVELPGEYELMQLLDRLEASSSWTAALSKLSVPSERRVVLIPPVVKCVACGCSSLTTITAASCHSQPIVYSTRGTLARPTGRLACHEPLARRRERGVVGGWGGGRRTVRRATPSNG